MKIITILNMHEFTDKAVFLRVKRHLLRQKVRASIDGDCLYRLEKYDGTVLRCAVGCLIPKKVYKSIAEIEGESANTVFQSINPIKISENKRLMLNLLQKLHDSYPVEKWKSLLNYIEKNWFNQDGSLSAAVNVSSLANLKIDEV